MISGRLIHAELGVAFFFQLQRQALVAGTRDAAIYQHVNLSGTM